MINITLCTCVYVQDRTAHDGKDMGLGGGNSGESSEEFEAHDFPDQGAIHHVLSVHLHMYNTLIM